MLLPIAWAPGPMELVIIGAVVFLLFGHRLPQMMRSLGAGVVEFKRGVQEGAHPEPESDPEPEPTPAPPSGTVVVSSEPQEVKSPA